MKHPYTSEEMHKNSNNIKFKRKVLLPDGKVLYAASCHLTDYLAHGNPGDTLHCTQ